MSVYGKGTNFLVACMLASAAPTSAAYKKIQCKQSNSINKISWHFWFFQYFLHFFSRKYCDIFQPCFTPNFRHDLNTVDSFQLVPSTDHKAY